MATVLINVRFQGLGNPEDICSQGVLLSLNLNGLGEAKPIPPQSTVSLLGRNTQGRKVGPDDDVPCKATSLGGAPIISFREGPNGHLVRAVI
jgi:hypothetical protein